MKKITMFISAALATIIYANALAALEECDVLVVGGGAAGISAALQAGRAGAKVVLVERGFQVGGNMTTGGVNFPGLFHAWGRQVIDGCAYEVVTNAVALSGENLPDFTMKTDQHWLLQLRFDIPVYVALAEEALIKAGVQICYHTAPMNVKWLNDKWNVELSANGERSRIDARVLIDCTGDGTLAALAGAKRMREQVTSPGSYMYTFANGRELWDRCDKAALERSYQEARDSGELMEGDFYGGVARIFECAPTTSWNYVPQADCSTAQSWTDTNLRARASLLRVYRFLKRQPGFLTLKFGLVSPEVGIRETWRVEGDYVMTVDDYVSGRVFPDSVCYAFYPVDLHSTEKGVAPKQLKEGVVPTVPLRSLCVKGVSNMLVAGRCISGDRLAVSGLRVQATCMATGQVVGEAAALAAKSNCEVREVPLKELKSRLSASGAIVPVTLNK